jgi:hypothetical protein
MKADKGTRTWDLKLVIVLVAALSVVTDMVGFLRFASSLGLPAWAAALGVIPTKLIEWKFLAFGAQLWQRGWLGKLQAPVCVPIWFLAVGLSALAAHATIFNALATADHTLASKVEARANLATSLSRVNARLEAFSKPLPRPAKMVEQALGWAASAPTVSRNCMRSFQEAARDEECKKVIELRKELATARDYERLIQEAETLREKLAGLNIETSHDPMPHAFEATLGRVVQIDGKNGIAFMGTLMLGLVSAFGFFGLDTLRAAPSLPEPTGTLAQSVGAAQGNNPQGAQVIQFRSAQRGGGICPPITVPGRSGGAPTHIAGQTSRRARDDPRVGARLVQGRVDPAAAIAAVKTFVGKLEKGAHARATGSELANAYVAQRTRHGWPALPANVLGVCLRAAVEELGGRKLKSGVQVYEGVRLPTAWRESQAHRA